ncbi:unnamed protein product [Prorocentrum cordatum]|uniref:Uncharacterized protein n=1 Tax=Prorocentrum cordatum TaxID=2364126 RepID=A0ABN9SA82_9DINO|nr:unnamed protein product [Polarella glacialis]
MASERLKDEIANFLLDRELIGGMLARGVVACADVAALVLQPLQQSDAAGPHHVAALVASRPDAHNLRMEDGAFEVDLLTEVLNHFTNHRLSAADMDDVYEMVGPPPMLRQAKSRRYAKTSALPRGSASASSLAPQTTAPAEPAAVTPYAPVDRDTLAARLELRDEEVAQLKEEIRKLRGSRQLCMGMAEKLEVDLHDANQKIATLTAAVNFRTGRNATVHGGYSLAVRRNLGRASTAATLAMVTGDGEGSVEDPNTVVSYEHRAAVGKVLRSRVFYDDDVGVVADQLEIHPLECDATNAELIQRKKVHVSMMHSSICNLSHAASLNSGDPAPTDVAEAAETHSITGDLLTVEKDSGPETLAFMQTHLESVYCPPWQSRASATAEEKPFFASVYGFGVDAGPGNQCDLRKVREQLQHAPPRVMFCAMFCFMHQVHLIVKDLLVRTEGFEWGPLKDGKRYWGTVATVASVWRPPSMSLGAADVAHRYFRKSPGQPLRGRWGSASAVEKLIIEAKTFTGAVFKQAFGKDAAGPAPMGKAKAKAAAKPKKKRAAKVGDDEEAAHRQQQGDWRGTAVACTGDAMWLAMVHISYIVKEPLTVYLYAAQKKKGEYERNVKDAQPSAYLGPIPLSDLVATAGRGANVYRDLQALFSDDAQGAGGSWEPVWGLLPAGTEPRARLLIVALWLRALAGWSARILKRTGEFPLLLLRVLDDPRGDDSADRWGIAAALLRRDRGSLVSLNGDLAGKIRDLFRDDWRAMVESGQCSARLYVFLLVWRIRLPRDTQGLEGANSVLQRMARIAPNLHIPLASDRLRLKLGAPIGAEDCVDLHGAIMDQFRTHDYAGRFLPVVVAEPLEAAGPPPPPAFPRCDAAIRAAARYAYVAGALMPTYMDRAFTFVEGAGEDRAAFLMCWSYHSEVSCATGVLRPLGGGAWFFHLDRPVRIATLTEVIGEMAAEAMGKGLGKGGAAAPLPARSGILERLSLHRAKYRDEEVAEVTPKPPKADADGKPIDAGLEDIVAAAMGDVMEEDGECDGAVGGDGHGRGGDDGLGGHPEDAELDEEGAPVPEPDEVDAPAGHGVDPDGHGGGDGGTDEPLGHGGGDDGHGRGGDGHGGDGSSGDSAPASPGGPAPGAPVLGVDWVGPRVVAQRNRAARALRDAHRNADARRGEAIDYGTIGLVTTPDGRCSFVLWTDVGRRRARPVRIDSDGRIISMMHFAQPDGDYADAVVVVGNAGLVQPYRKRKHERPAVDPWLLLLQLEGNTQFSQGPLPLASSDPN